MIRNRPIHDSARRLFVKQSVAVAITSTGSLLAGTSLAADSGGAIVVREKAENPDRHLHIVNIHTGESLAATYWSDGLYVKSVMHQIDVLMRDHRVNEILPMDLRVIDFLSTVQRSLDSNKPLQVLSGYRSPETNAKLAKRSRGVAKNSLHMQGRAIDFRLPGTRARVLRDIALKSHLGGVGYYGKSDFVHIDSGPFRHWG